MPLRGTDSRKGSLRTPGPTGPKPSSGAKLPEGNSNTKGGKPLSGKRQQFCQSCKAPTRFVGMGADRWIICSEQPAHNKSSPYKGPVEKTCPGCNTKSKMIEYPTKLFCLNCKMTINRTATGRATSSDTKGDKKRSKSSPQKPAGKPADKPPTKPSPPKKRVEKPASKPQTSEKPKTDKPAQPEPSPKPKAKKPVKWVDHYCFDNTEHFTSASGTQVSRALNTAERRAKCRWCNGRITVFITWAKTTPDYKGNKNLTLGKAFETTLQCLKDKCLGDGRVVVEFVKSSKPAPKIFVSPVVPKGVPILTEQPRHIQGTAIQPPAMTEEQVRGVFEAVASKHKIKDAIVAALRQANQDFRASSLTKRKALTKAAQAAIANIAKVVPRNLNARWNKPSPQLRTIPMRLTVPRVQVLNPLWSVTLAMVSAEDKLEEEHVHAIQHAAYMSAILEHRLIKSRPPQKGKPKEKSTGESEKVNSAPSPHAEIETKSMPGSQT